MLVDSALVYFSGRNFWIFAGEFDRISPTLICLKLAWKNRLLFGFTAHEIHFPIFTHTFCGRIWGPEMKKGGLQVSISSYIYIHMRLSYSMSSGPLFRIPFCWVTFLWWQKFPPTFSASQHDSSASAVMPVSFEASLRSNEATKQRSRDVHVSIFDALGSCFISDRIHVFYLPICTFTYQKQQPNVGRYSIHGLSGIFMHDSCTGHIVNPMSNLHPLIQGLTLGE